MLGQEHQFWKEANTFYINYMIQIDKLCGFQFGWDFKKGSQCTIIGVFSKLEVLLSKHIQQLNKNVVILMDMSKENIMINIKKTGSKLSLVAIANALQK